MEEAKFSTPCKLIDLEGVINTRTPVWDIGRNGDVRIKLDTDVNDQEWYVISPDDGRDPLMGSVPCWAFPHFNGAFDTYGYEPVECCFKTFAELLATYPTERPIWGYDLDEYAQRLAYQKKERRAEKSFHVTHKATHPDEDSMLLTSEGAAENAGKTLAELRIEVELIRVYPLSEGRNYVFFRRNRRKGGPPEYVYRYGQNDFESWLSFEEMLDGMGGRAKMPIWTTLDPYPGHAPIEQIVELWKGKDFGN